MNNPRRASALLVALALVVLVLACSDSGPAGPEDGAMVTVQFVPAQSLVTAMAFPDLPFLAPTTSGQPQLESVYLVVDEFKLEGNDEACSEPGAAPDCAKFEADPHLLALNLASAQPQQMLDEMAPPGTFTSLKFETKWRGADEGVLAEMDAEGITDWPSNASMMVTGRFTPEGASTSEPFRVFFDAEVKVVLPLPSPLVIDRDEEGTRVISIEVDPNLWFAMNAEYVDLLAMDFDTTGEVYYLEVKLEDGFTKIEFD